VRVGRESFSSKRLNFASKSENSGSNRAALNSFHLLSKKVRVKSREKKGKYERPLRTNGFERESL